MDTAMSALIENMISAGDLSPAARDMNASDALLQWAEANGIEYVDAEFSDGTVISGPIVFYNNGIVAVKEFMSPRAEDTSRTVAAKVDWDYVEPHNVAYMEHVYHRNGLVKDIVSIRPE